MNASLNKDIQRRFMIRAAIHSCATFAIAGWLGTTALSQTLPDRGFLPSLSYDSSSTDDINLQNGNLIYHVPIYKFPAGPGGQSLEIGLTYNSAIYDPDMNASGGAAANLYRSESNASGGGWQWSYNYRLYDNYNTNEPLAVFPDGSHHVFYLRNLTTDATTKVYPYVNGKESIDPTGNDSNGACAWDMGGKTAVYYSADSTFLRLEITFAPATGCNPPSGSPTWVLYFPNGTRVLGSGVDGATTGGPSTTNQVVDRNGNTITIQGIMLCSVPGPGCSSDTPANLITDQLGRKVVVSYPNLPNTGAGAATDTVCAPGHVESGSVVACDSNSTSANGQLHWIVNWNTYTPTDTSSYYNVNYSSSPVYPGGFFITSISLPSVNSEQLSYQFTYTLNPGWGEMQSATTPYGLTTKYAYWCALAPDNTCEPSHDRFTQFQPNVQVKSRTQSWTDGTGATRTQSWMYSQIQNISQPSVTVTAPDGGQTVHTMCGTNSAFSNLECQRILPNGDTVVSTWQGQCLFAFPANGGVSGVNVANPQIWSETRTVNKTTGSLSATTSYSYDRNGNLLGSTESPFLSTVRTTSNVFAIVPSSPVIATYANVFQPPSNCKSHVTNDVFYDQDAYWTSTLDTSASLPGWTLNAPISKSIAANGSSSTWTYGYDQSTGTANVTSETNGLVTIGHSYDGAGNLLTTTDGNGVVTKFTYASTGCNASSSFSSSTYPDSIVRDYGGSLARTTTQTWDCVTGQLMSRTEPTQVTTKFGYDLIGRRTLSDEGTGQTAERVTHTVYSEANSGSGSLTPLTVTTTTGLNSADDQALATIQYFDQRGTLWKTQAPSLAITQRFARLSLPGDSSSYELISNPYFSSSDPTVGWTRSQYDSSGRLTGISHFSTDPSSPPCPFGNSVLTTCSGSAAADSATSNTFDGNVATLNDEAGISHQNTYDGLGRLVNVTECANCTNSFSTSYTYDYGDRLATVTQGASTSPNRSFLYDSRTSNFCYQS